MARTFLPRTSQTLPKRGHALAKINLVDENGFVYEYAELEVPMSVAREVIAQLHLHSDAAKSAAPAVELPGGRATRASRKRSA